MNPLKHVWIAIAVALVVLVAEANANEPPEYNYADSLFCQFVSQHTGDTSAMIDLWEFNRKYAVEVGYSPFDLNASMIIQNTRAIEAIKSVRENTNQGFVKSSQTVFLGNGCKELVRKIRGLRES